MPYELKPRCGTLPPASEVARLIATEFAWVKVDAEDGLKQARARAAWIERTPARVFLGHHREALESAARLKALALGEALTIEFGDDAGNTLRAVVIPGDTMKLGFRSNEEQSTSLPLVTRCARILDCDLEVV